MSTNKIKEPLKVTHAQNNKVEAIIIRSPVSSWTSVYLKQELERVYNEIYKVEVLEFDW